MRRPGFACFVQGVQGLCRVLCRRFHSCAGCAGSITCARTREIFFKHQKQKGCSCACNTLHTLHTLHTPYKSMGYVGFTLHNTLHTPCTRMNTRTRTIKCTAENAKEVQDLVKNDPELLALVQSLQAQGVFPGLRGLSFTFVGDESTLAKGLGAWPAKNAPQAAFDDAKGA